LTPEFKRINPNKMVPAMVEIDTLTGEEWSLFESNAILRYLATTRKVPDHWYP
jgi:glutathione S-transferase